MRKFEIGDKVIRKGGTWTCIVEDISTCSKCGKYSIYVGTNREDGLNHNFYSCSNCCGDTTPISTRAWYSSDFFRLKPNKILIL